MGAFSFHVVDCGNSPVSIVGYDLDALLTSPGATFTNPGAALNVGDIQVCTALSELIEITFDGQSYVFLEHIALEHDNVWTAISSETDARYVSFQFENNQQTGTFPLDYFYLYPAADSLSTINLSTTVSQFGPEAIGTINGTVQSNNGQSHTVSGSYRVKF
jgi:hypothetical protein